MPTYSQLSRILTILAALVVSTGLAISAESADKPAATPYPLDHCIVSGDKFGGDMGEPIVKVYDGKEVKFCCKGCIPKYEKDPAKFNAKIEAEAQAVKVQPVDKGHDDTDGHDDHHHDKK